MSAVLLVIAVAAAVVIGSAVGFIVTGLAVLTVQDIIRRRRNGGQP